MIPMDRIEWMAMIGYLLGMTAGMLAEASLLLALPVAFVGGYLVGRAVRKRDA
jgi:hypothetical protein